MRKQLHMVKNWVIVGNDGVFHYETFEEAAANNTVLNGHLMSKSYYENHYKNEYVTNNSTIPNTWD